MVDHSNWGEVNKMSDRTLTMLAVGDVIPQTSQPPDPLFALVAPVLRSANVVVGQGEVPFTSRGVETFAEGFLSTSPCDPSNISALHSAGFNVITLASNHIFDLGAPGVEDTIAGLKNYGIAVVGAGMNIDEAKRPAVVERDGTQFGFLSYNCIGPKGSWAGAKKPGCAYVHIITHYELDSANPGGPPTVYTFAEPRSLAAMVDDIRKLRPLCDILVVALHKGVFYLPTKMAMYEQQVSYAAIDAGADLVLGHHSHVLQGIEQYKGRTIFHGLGNFMVFLESFAKEGSRASRPSPLLGSPMGWWAEPPAEGDPEKPIPPTPQGEGRRAIIAKCIINGRRISRVSYLPCLINDQGQPEILKNDERGQQQLDYMIKITKAIGLNARYRWEGDEVVIYSE
jgi:hypothetical protein